MEEVEALERELQGTKKNAFVDTWGKEGVSDHKQVNRAALAETNLEEKPTSAEAPPSNTMGQLAVEN